MKVKLSQSYENCVTSKLRELELASSENSKVEKVRVGQKRPNFGKVRELT